MKLQLTAILIAAALTGCNSAPKATLVEPATINLTEALKQIHESLNAAAEQTTADGKHTGLDICTATVALTLSATGNSVSAAGGGVGVGPPVIPVTLAVNLSTQQTLTDVRGNVITLVLTTPGCNPAGTLGTVSPGKVIQLANANKGVRDRKITPQFVPANNR